MTPAGRDTFPRLLLEHAKHRPDRAALRRKRFGIWQTCTWRQYAARTRDLALGLRRLGLRPGRTVAIVADNTPEWLFAELGAQSLGAIPLGVYSDTPPAALADLLARAETSVVVAGDQQQVDKVLEARPRLAALETIVYIEPKGMRHYRHPGLVSFEDVEGRGREAAASEPGLFAELVQTGDASAAGLLLATSGTGGRPKLVAHAQRSLILAARSWHRIDPRGPDDEHVSYLPLAWSGEQVMMALVLEGGSIASFPEGPETAMADLREISPTHILGSPRVWEGIAARILGSVAESTPVKRRLFERCLLIGRRAAALQLAGRPVPAGVQLARHLADLLVFRATRDKAGLKRARYAYASGAPLGGDYMRLFSAIGVNLKQVYALTETGPLTCSQDDDVKAETVGPALGGVELRISDAGEILARTPACMLGYHGDPEATTAAFEDGWLRTGDAGALTPDAHLTVLDRLTDLAELADGTRFSPMRLESKLKFSPYVQDAVVCGHRQPFLVALVTIDGVTTGKWAERRRLPFTSYTDLAQKPEISGLLEAEIARANVEIPEKLRIQRYLVLPKEFDADDEELTPTRKVRREAIHQRYGELIRAMFDGVVELPFAIRYRYEDGSQQVLKVPIRIRGVADRSGGGPA